MRFSEMRWPRGPRCPFCPNRTRVRVTRLRGKAHRRELYKCKGCRQQFTATVGTPFADTHLSDSQIGRAIDEWRSKPQWGRVARISERIGVGYSTAWHLARRIEKWEVTSA